MRNVVIGRRNCLTMRKLLCSLTALVLLGLQTFAQDQCVDLGIEVEVVAEHNYSAGDPLEALNGQTTYRLYVTTGSATDFLSAVAGDDTNPINITTSTSFFQEPTISVLTGDDNNEAFYAAFPLQQYDSWVTIGRASSADAGGDVNAVSGLVDWAGNFEDGNNLEISDAIGGSWFALNGDVNGVVGDDLKVLLGQFTTDGDFSGNVYVQIFPNSVGSDEYRCNLEFAYMAEEVEGCTNDAACNFDPAATLDDGSCDLPNGCTDDMACNFDFNATCDDGSCVIVSAGELSGDNGDVACSGDGMSDLVSFIYESFDSEGSNTAWVVTDLAANILAIIPSTPMAFDMIDIDFEGYAAGEVLVWYITYTDLFNAGIGENAAELEGCFDLSNPVSVSIAAAGCNDPIAINYNADACGDDGSCEYDGEACMVACPEDMMLECTDDTTPAATGIPTLSGNCGEAEVTMLDDVMAGDDCLYTITRTWEITIPDGNVETCSQVLTVMDTTGPAFIDFPENVVVECEEDIPAVFVVDAEDACSGLDSVAVFTSVTGYPVEECITSTSYGLGDDWAVWLPVLETSGVSLTDDFVPSGELSYTKYNDGTAHVSGMVVNNMNISQGFIVDFWFENTVDWETWSTGLGRSYKDDAGFAAAGGDLWTTWDYMEMVNGFSTLTGFGDFEGSVLSLNHMPSNYYFGFQCGEAANNKNSNFGMSGWFTYTGIINGEVVSGHGDINVDKECTPVPPPSVLCSEEVQETIFYRAVDNCGNATMDSYTVTVNDTTDPVFTVVPEDLLLECNEVPVPVFEGIEATDNCDCELIFLPMEESEIEGTTCNYSFTRTWSVLDCCGNRADHTQTITVVDSVAPVFTFVPADVTYECDVDFELEDATSEDNCQVVVSDVTSETIAGDCPQEYTIVRTFTISDECNEPVVATQTIIVVDTTAPSVSDYDVETSANCEDLESVPGPEFEDNCGEVTVTLETQNQSGGCMGVLVRYYTATDECGNTVSVEQYITILDTTPPVIITPVDETVECDAVPVAPGAEGAEVSDNCALEVDVTFSEEIISGLCDDSYTIVWTWIAVDYCENMSEASTTITVVDTTNPVFVQVPEDLLLECDEEIPSCDDQIVIAEDNCDEELVIECTDNIIAGDCPQEYTIQRVYRAFDNCGNQGLYMQTITIVDTTAPEFEFVAEDETIECDMDIPAADAEAFDNCGTVSIEVTEEEVAGDCPQNYSIIRTYTAMDECGNMNTAMQTITIVDTTAPVFTEVGMDETIECDMVIPAPFATAEDNCGIVTITQVEELTPTDCPQEYTIVRMYTATDECGNASTVIQTITVVDTTAPEFEEYSIQVEAPCDNLEVVELTATDNCDLEVSVTFIDTPVSGGCAGVIIRDYIATDCAGNSSTAQQIITLTDVVAPVLMGVPSDDTFECGLEEIPAPADVTVEDNCDMEIEVMFSETENMLACGYEIVRTWSAIDHCDNEVSASQTITIVDTTAPVFDLESYEETLDCNVQVLLIAPEAFDACDGDVEVTTGFESIPGDCPNEWTEIFTYTATDNCENTSSVSITLNYIDDSAPEFTFVPFSNEVSCDQPLPTEDATAEDNCGAVTITSNDVIVLGECENNYEVIRSWIATDECGNASEAVTTYFVYDATAPVFTTVLTDVNVECVGDVPAAPEVAATDNCSEVIITSDSDMEMDDCGNYVEYIEYTATDACGNQSFLGYSVTVDDMTAPELEGLPSAITVLDCEDEIPAPAEVTALDNCEGVLDVDYNEVLIGELPAEGSTADCLANTPEAFENGELCTGEDPWSLKLFNFNGLSSALYNTIEANWIEYPDGSATLTGSVVSNLDPNRGWNIDVEFENALDWADWSTQEFPTSFKDDCNESGENHFDWTYYIMTAGATLTGWGTFEDATLSIAHAPSNNFYAYQVGVAANNVNVNYGSGGWFTYSGIFDGAEVMGSGDFAFDHDCCPRYSIERTWCAEDCSGNDICFTQLISFEGLGNTLPVAGVDAEEAQEDVAKGDAANETRLTAYPNPAMNKSFVEFTLAKASSARVEIFSLNGQKVADLFNADADAQQLYRIEFNAAALPVGVYLYRLTTENEVITNRIIINK